MYNIGIIGSEQDRITDTNKVKHVVCETMDLLDYQYSNMAFNIKGDIGVGIWALEHSIESNYRYNLHLPYSIENTCQYWYKSQQELLYKAYEKAYSISICQNDSSKEDEANKRIIDNSNFTICFWAGNKQGSVYDAIVYAMNNSKMVIDGLNGLKMITADDIKR